MSRDVSLPAVDMSEYVLPRSKGGTGVAKLTEVAQAVGLIDQTDKNVPGGVAGLDANAKVLASVLPTQDMVNWVNVSGTFRLVAGSTNIFIISDYDSFKVYTLSCSNGTISRIDDTITYVANSILGAHTFTLNGRVFDFTIEIPAPEKPAITSPTLNANILTTGYTFTGSSFVEFGDLATHQGSDWQISTSSNFGAIAYSTSNDAVNKTSWSVTGLVDGLTYYARVRYRASNGNASLWSDPVAFTVAVPVPARPSVTSPTNNQVDVAISPTIVSSAFTALGDGSTHDSTDWQIATDSGFTNLVQSINNSSTNKTSWTPGSLAILTDHYVRVRHRSSNGKVSAWSNVIKFTTANVYPFAQVISTNVNNYNLRTAAVAAGWDQVTPLQADITINAGVVVGSTSNTTYAFDVDANFPVGSPMKLTNNGTIAGKGGNGNGGNGGPALRVLSPMIVDNSNGVIGGGGGAGGAGQGILRVFEYLEGGAG